MSYIIELRINNKERIVQISDEQGRALQKQYMENSMPPKIMTNGEAMSTTAIQLISPFSVWWEKDKVGLDQKRMQRCGFCMMATPYGTSCGCKPKNALPAPTEAKTQPLTLERLRAGWIRAIAAMFASNPNMTAKSSWFPKRLVEQYAIAPEEAGLPTGTW